MVDDRLTQATGTAEREAAVDILSQKPARRVSLGGDKPYDSGDSVEQLRGMNVTPHMAQNDTSRRSAIDGWTTRAWAMLSAKRVEEVFRLDEDNSTATENALSRTGESGLDGRLGAEAYNLVKMRNRQVVAGYGQVCLKGGNIPSDTRKPLNPQPDSLKRALS